MAMLELKRVRWGLVIATFICAFVAALFIRGAWSISFMGVVAYVVFRQTQPGAIVLWFRRFRQRPERGRSSFARVLNVARLQLFVPVTLQDSSYKRSLLAQQFTGARFVFGSAAAMTAAFLGMMAFSHLEMELGASDVLGEFMVALGAITGAGVVFLIGLRTGGYVSAASLAEAARHLHKLQQGRGGYAGIEVMKCADGVWKPVVEYALRQAGAAVFDVSEVSESLSWELAAAQRIMGPQRIILACSYIDKREFPEGVDSLIRSTVGCDHETLPIIWYPARHSRRSEYLNAAAELRSILLRWE